VHVFARRESTNIHTTRINDGEAVGVFLDDPRLEKSRLEKSSGASSALGTPNDLGAPGIGPGFRGLELVAFSSQLFDLRRHASEQFFGGCGVHAKLPELSDVALLPTDLLQPVLKVLANEVQAH
jgi:hypothetical protein